MLGWRRRCEVRVEADRHPGAAGDCAKAFGDDDGNGVAEGEEDGNVIAPNVNLSGGALTGGFCSRKRWC